MLQGKKIILGITGSIAAYKAAMLVRLFVKAGAEVQVVMTPAAKEFITPLTLATLSRKPVISEFFSNRDGTWNSHVELGLWADAMLIAPATAASIAKMANGVADNMLITTYLSCRAPVFVAPAMDMDMYKHPATQKNLETLRSYGNVIIEPASGELASGLDGKGRMAEPSMIFKVLDKCLISRRKFATDPFLAKMQRKAEATLFDVMKEEMGEETTATANPKNDVETKNDHKSTNFFDKFLKRLLHDEADASGDCFVPRNDASTVQRRHCERSEAISSQEEERDCFVPRNDGDATDRDSLSQREAISNTPSNSNLTGLGDLSGLNGKKILITAGPTYEKLDPVRFIGNYSSGKMGFAIAAECVKQGAQVTLIAGPVALATPEGTAKRIDVESADEMYEAAVAAFPQCDAAILCAAVADFKPRARAEEKIKREKTGDMTLELVQNRDIAAALCSMKQPHQKVAGFALETGKIVDNVNNAASKMKHKGLDMIVLNSLNEQSDVFGGDNNKVVIFENNGPYEIYNEKPKTEVAKDILSHLSHLFALILLIFSMSYATAAAQELNATLTINSDKVQGTDKNIFNTLQTSLLEFINSRKWTTATFNQNERIDCGFTIIVNSLDGNKFSCEIQIQARRPVFNSAYTTTIFNYRDTEFDFEYTEFQPLQHTEETLDSNLTATIIYYIYVILGFDFDSFALGGGKPFYQQAQQIVNLTQSQPSWNGWTAFGNKKNRHALITALTEQQGEPFHSLWYTYHRKGLDEMAANADRGRTNILAALPLLKDLKSARPNSILLQIFDECKLDETVLLYSKATTQEKQEGLKLFNSVFPASTMRYESLKN